MQLFINLVILILICSASLSRAALLGASPLDLLVGPEFTFTNDNLILLEQEHDPQEINFRAKLKYDWLIAIEDKIQKKYQQSCPDCQRDKFTNQIKLPNGNFFEIIMDPMVLEVIVSPMTLEQYQEMRDLLQDLIFNTAAELKLKPHIRIGGGHIHLDVTSHFKNKHLLLRNFIVDSMNHPEIYMGPLNLDLLNAPPMAVLDPVIQSHFRKELKLWDNKYYSDSEFVQIMREEVYKKTFVDTYPHVQRHASKYQLINFDHWPNTLELRGFRPQKDIDHFIRNVKMIEERLKYLSKFSKPIPLRFNNYHQQVKWGSHKFIEFYSVDISYDDSVRKLKKYLEEMGLSWEEYQQDLDYQSMTFGHTAPLCRAVFR